MQPDAQLETEAEPLPIEPYFDPGEAAPWEPGPEQARLRAPFKVEHLAEILRRVDAAPAPAYIIRGIMAEGDHGMLAAEFKAGKTWAVGDLAVSVASGTPWLGLFEIDSPGGVLLFAGEGGERKVVRRFRAICESRGLDASHLPIRVCMRVPHLTDEAAMLLVEDEIEQNGPTLVIIDPLYLAARGARGSDLYEMGAHLEGAQSVCQRHGAALLIVHHWNKTGEGRGAKRMSGAGPDAWGRVLISASVMARSTDPTSQASSVTLEFDFQGDEIAERTIKVCRRVWADDPEDLASALHYEVTPIERLETPSDPRLAGLSPAAVRVLTVLEEADGWLTVRQIGDVMAEAGDGRPVLRARTIQDALNTLDKVGQAENDTSTGGRAGQWRSASAHSTDSGAENAS